MGLEFGRNLHFPVGIRTSNPNNVVLTDCAFDF